MNRGRVKIKRKRLGEFTSSQKTLNRVPIRNTITSSKAKNRRSNTRSQGQVTHFEIVRGLRSDSKRMRLSNRRTEQQQQRARSMNRPNINRVSGSQNRPKLFTKDFDARRRIDAKRQKGNEDSASKVKTNSKVMCWFMFKCFY